MPSLEMDMNETLRNEKVVAFPAARIVRRGPADPAAAKFLGDVISLMKDKTGLDYMEAKEILHGKDKGFMEFIRDALDRGSSPEEFVRFTVESNGFKTFGPGEWADEVESYNVAQLFIIEFANDMPDWSRGTKGEVTSLIYTSDGAIAGCAIMHPIIDRVARDTGIAIRVHDRGFDDPESDRIHFKNEPSQKYAGYDIEDPVVELDDYKASFQQHVAYIR